MGDGKMEGEDRQFEEVSVVMQVLHQTVEVKKELSCKVKLSI